jgi:hypothetical protein
VTITSDGEVRRVHTAAYDAAFEPDGLTSLRVGGVEFVQTGVKFGDNGENGSRGAFLYNPQTRRLVNLGKPQVLGGTISAISAEGGMSIDFGRGSFTWTVFNRGGPDLQLFVVFSPAVKAVTRGGGDWQVVPPPVPPNAQLGWEVRQDWTKTTWFAGKAKLTFSDGTAFFGPWPSLRERYEVWMLAVPPGQPRRVEVILGEASPDEAKQVAELTGGR